jgi:diacylglycerol O-acyltransferase / wax synthase
VAGVLVLDPPRGDDAAGAASRGPTSFDRIRAVIAERLPLVPRLRQRAVRVPLDLQRPLWADDPAFDLDAHVRRSALPSPGGRSELNDFLGDVMARPLPPDRPLWEMVVVEGLEGGRSAVVARLHHAILDGVSGATAMAAFLDLEPQPAPSPAGSPGPAPSPAAPPGAPAPRAVAPEGEPVGDGGVGGLAPAGGLTSAGSPTSASLIRYAAASMLRQPEVVLDAFNRSLDALAALTAQNRRLAAEGRTPPPTLFRVPRTSINGNVTSERVTATLTVPLADLERVRRACGDVTVNDIILCAVGDAVWQLLASRGEHPGAPLVALVPVSTRGRATVPEDGAPAHVGNAISGMLVPLPANETDPFDRLRVVAQAAQVSKDQEHIAGGDLLEGLTRAAPPALVRMAMQGVGRLRLFDRLPPPFNLAVSTIMLPDVTLWWADREVSAVYPLGPVVDGIGLNVTAMTYRESVHLGLVACPRLIPELEELATLLGGSFEDLVVRAGMSSLGQADSPPGPPRG